jgi:hypothetical protein
MSYQGQVIVESFWEAGLSVEFYLGTLYPISTNDLKANSKCDQTNKPILKMRSTYRDASWEREADVRFRRISLSGTASDNPCPAASAPP